MASNQNKNLVNGGYPFHKFDDLLDLVKEYISNKEDIANIEKAYRFMYEKHAKQVRKSGEPYYHHPLEVAYIVTELRAGPATIIAALLHDTVEDTDATINNIETMFGKDVAKLVDALTKISALKLSKRMSTDFEAEDHRKILLGMAKDIRVIIIKLADRLHNMRTLASLSEERKKVLSKETLEVFVPIASRLGLEVLKAELADLCLKYGEPEKYTEIKSLLNKKTKVLQKSLDGIKKRIADALFEKGISFDISARIKSIYSIYTKMYVKGHSFDQIYDILALRIITNTEIECYEALGLIHQMYRPVSGRFKDYIASPKTNMYQSLHTTIVSGDGNFYEVQIRTKHMDEIAETGVAAHWAYKEGSNYNPANEQKEIEDKLHWFRDFVSLSKDTKNNSANEYMESLTHDIFEANVYVFTPMNKVIELPSGSTPVDFAYRVHSRVGDTCVGATVNGLMVPLNTILKTGDIVDIKTNKNSPGPSERWLEFVASSQAKNRIKKFLLKKNEEILKEEKIAKGKASLLEVFEDRGLDEAKMMEMISSDEVLTNYHSNTVDDLFLCICNKNPTPNAVVEFLKIKRPEQQPVFEKVKDTSKNKSHVYCKGIDTLAISLANCCSPIPGDDIVGYVTQGKGIVVHRKACPNMANVKDRLVEVFWRENIEFASYPVELSVEANDRPNLLVDILNAMSSNKVGVVSIHARYINRNSGSVLVSLTVNVSDVKRLDDVINILHSVTNVYRVNRVIH